MEKSSRPIRNRRHNRRVWPPGDTHRPVKRLFTPDIKRMLKDWLVRRRDNPYPSRDEKKALAFETGLTYTQICNWFANWRRKLKNSGKEPTKKTWGHLIKNYNVNAKGNVEQFSICSEDSIWGDNDRSSSRTNSPYYSDCGNYEDHNNNNNNNSMQRKHDYMNYNTCNNNNNNGNHEEYFNNERGDQHLNQFDPNYKNYFMNNGNYNYNQNESAIDHYYTTKTTINDQCFQITSTLNNNNSSIITNNINNNTTNHINNNNNSDDDCFKTQNHVFTSNTKYKQQMMEKYLRDNCNKSTSTSSSSNSPELSKWLESAANFTPNKNNYYIEWNLNKNKPDKKQSRCITNGLSNCANFYLNNVHQKEELDAAEALANLACNYKQRMLNSPGNYLSTY